LCERFLAWKESWVSIVKSILAVLAGLVFIVATHMGMDEAMHAAGVFPPKGEPMFDPGLNALALGYRCVFSVLGCALTAWLAPRARMAHALTLGAIGTVLSSAGAAAMIPLNLGPVWYPVALAASALPCAWVGGKLVKA
jgi:hypothetical protein